MLTIFCDWMANMLQRHKRMKAFLLTLILLASCSESSGFEPTRFSTPSLPQATKTNITEPSNTTTPTTMPTQVNDIATFEVTPAPTNLFTNKNQVSDGKLRISIKEPDSYCHVAGKTIPIEISFQNLTNYKLTIVDFNIISPIAMTRAHALLFPILTNMKNERIRLPGEFGLTETKNPNSPMLQPIFPNASFEFLAEYHLPGEMAEYNENHQLQNQALPVGQYLLKLIYFAFGFEDTWEGTIGSNQIEICVAN